MASPLVVTGSRSSSVAGSRQGTRDRPRSGYRKIGNTSEVDETLFKSHSVARMSQSQESSPFLKSPTPKVKGSGPPLLWAPPVTNKRPEKFLKTPTPQTPNESNKYRLRGHTPTYVDETLFGPKLEEPSFPAPWGDRKRKPKPFTWAPPQPHEFSCERQLTQARSEVSEPFSVDGRPPSRQGRRPGSKRTRPCTVESMASSSKSQWRP